MDPKESVFCFFIVVREEFVGFRVNFWEALGLGLRIDACDPLVMKDLLGVGRGRGRCVGLWSGEVEGEFRWEIWESLRLRRVVWVWR